MARRSLRNGDPQRLQASASSPLSLSASRWPGDRSKWHSEQSNQRRQQAAWKENCAGVRRGGEAAAWRRLDSSEEGRETHLRVGHVDAHGGESSEDRERRAEYL